MIYFDDWFIPLTRSASKKVYVTIDRENRIYFSRTQLQKLHRQFFHTASVKLFNLIRRARPEHATTDTINILKDISARCYPCQRIRPGPVRFRVSFGAEHVRFNKRIIMDIIYIDSWPVLHIVDDGTRFYAAQFLRDISIEEIWDCIFRC